MYAVLDPPGILSIQTKQTVALFVWFECFITGVVSVCDYGLV